MSEEAVTEAAPQPQSAPDPAQPASEGGQTGGSAPSNDQAVEAAMADAEASGEDLDLNRMVTVKVDGEERSIPLAEAVKNYELSRASHKRFQEASQRSKAIEQKEAELRQFVEALRDPGTLLRAAKELGLTPDQLREAMEAEAKVTPEQRRAMELQERERAIAERERAYEEQRKREQLTAAAQREQERFSREFNAALAKHELQGHPDVIAEMAKVMETAIEAGYPMSADEAADLALENLRGTTSATLGKMDPKQLRKVLGDDVVRALAKEVASDVKRTHEPRANPRPFQPRPNEGEPKKKLRIGELPDDFFDRR